MKKITLIFSVMFVLLFGITSGASAATSTYTVKKGDTLSKIAKVNKVSVTNLKKWNNLKSDKIYPKQKLKIQSSNSTTNKKTNKVKVITVSATAYTGNCKGCSGITATGLNLKKNPNLKVISVDPKVIKLGTKVYVEGYGYAIAADKGSAIKGNRIDVFIPSQKKALQWGRKTVKVKILN